MQEIKYRTNKKIKIDNGQMKLGIKIQKNEYIGLDIFYLKSAAMVDVFKDVS